MVNNFIDLIELRVRKDDKVPEYHAVDAPTDFKDFFLRSFIKTLSRPCDSVPGVNSVLFHGVSHDHNAVLIRSLARHTGIPLIDVNPRMFLTETQDFAEV